MSKVFSKDAGKEMNNTISKALEELRKGNIILVYDAEGREEETDMVIASEHVKPETIRTLRKDAGGLICTTVPPHARKCIGIPYMVDVLSHSKGIFPIVDGLKPNDIPYDTKSSFSLTINHRKTFTGITDRDRALTVSEFSKIVRMTLSCENGYASETFAKNFRSPGHVHLLNASDGLTLKRQGHTELATAITILAGLTPTATICEMMGEDGYALSKEKAMKYAEENGLVFLEGKEIIEVWRAEESSG
ncbi:MAG: 3,4-dihydroxy-2-butanone-4-phosphate synthase [Thermoplasmata archaeon]|nr:3,4-dihydroxy-2-butanone-4-phosphate synthase [Thermoplasmata archaeon]